MALSALRVSACLIECKFDPEEFTYFAFEPASILILKADDSASDRPELSLRLLQDRSEDARRKFVKNRFQS